MIFREIATSRTADLPQPSLRLYEVVDDFVMCFSQPPQQPCVIGQYGIQSLVKVLPYPVGRRLAHVLQHGGIELVSHLVEVGAPLLQFWKQLVVEVGESLGRGIFRLHPVILVQADGCEDQLGDVAVEGGIGLLLEHRPVGLGQPYCHPAGAYGHGLFRLFGFHIVSFFVGQKFRFSSKGDASFEHSTTL